MPKNTYTIKGRFELNERCLTNVVREVEKQNKDIKFKIKHSPIEYSNTLYLETWLGNHSTILRISDHQTKGDNFNALIIDENTTMSNVCYKIQQSIKKLRYKHTMQLIEEVTQEQDNESII